MPDLSPSVAPRLACGAILVLGAAVALQGCEGGDVANFNELLFVSDSLTVTSYSTTSNSATPLGTATIPGIPGTYSRAGSLVTVTMQNHNLVNGTPVALDFSAGTGGTATDGVYVPTTVDDHTFTVTDTASGAITGGTLLRAPALTRTASYAQAGTTVTVTMVGHGMTNGDDVRLTFSSGGAVDGDFTISVVDPDTFTAAAAAALTTSGVVDVTFGHNYTIFGMAMHPTGRWLYAASTYECFSGNPYCWGSDLISRFAIDWSSGALTFEKSFRTADDATNSASPVALAFSADGTRLVHQDDDLDGLRLWDVDVNTGELTLVAASAPGTTGNHGIALTADAARGYHGTSVFTIGASTIDRTVSGSTGSSTQIVNGTLFTLIGGGNSTLRAYALTDPDLPAQVAQSAITPHQARDFAVAPNGSTIVTSGFHGLKSYTFDGTSIVPAVGAGSTEYTDGGVAFPGPFIVRVYRTMSLNAAGDQCAAAYFTTGASNAIGGTPPSGFILLSVAADGSLTFGADFPTANYARVARFYSNPAAP